jgi:hypothetical protein
MRDALFAACARVLLSPGLNCNPDICELLGFNLRALPEGLNYLNKLHF